MSRAIAMYTRWGASQTIDDCGNGIQFVSTAGHGGYVVPAHLNNLIPEIFRQADRQYEEDCGWAVVDYFLNAFLNDHNKYTEALKTIKEWFWKQWEEYSGEVIPLPESRCKQEFVFHEEHKNDWLVVCASGDWKAGVPIKYVYCEATLGGVRGQVETRCFFVPAALYAARKFEYVIRAEEIELAKPLPD